MIHWLKKKNYSDYDYIVVFADHQDVDILTKTLNVNYFISGGRVIFPYIEKNKPVVIYLETADSLTFHPTVSSNPFYQRNLIDYNYIQRDSEFIKNTLTLNNLINNKPVFSFVVFKNPNK